MKKLVLRTNWPYVTVSSTGVLIVKMKFDAHANRENARKSGAKTYSGKQCPKFPSHGRTRYTIGANCVACALARGKALNRERVAVYRLKPVVIRPPYTAEQQARLDEGRALKFFGRECQNGHDGLRYSKTGQCVACSEAARPPKGLTKGERLKWVRAQRVEKRRKYEAEVLAMVERAKQMRAAEEKIRAARAAPEDEYEDLF
jgi:hypothetical protein